MLNYRSNKIMFNLMAILLLLLTLNNSSILGLKIIGQTSILLILGLSSFILAFLVFKTGQIKKNKLKFTITYLILICLFFISSFVNSLDKGFYSLSQLVLLINFFLMYSTLRYDEKKFISFNAILLSLTIYVFVFYTGLLTNTQKLGNYSSIYTNSNALGMIAFLLMGVSICMFILSRKKIFICYGVLFLIILYLSGTRSNLLAAIIVVTLFVLYKYISKNKILWNITFISIIISIMLITYIYPQLGEFNKYEQLSTLVYEFTGKRLLSGRDRIWSESIILIKNKPIFGYGTGTGLSDIIDINVSAHNLYIQILLQNGIIGLIIFFILILFLWNLFYKGRKVPVVRFCACFFISILYQNMFEVTLLQNNMSIAIIQWFIISIGISNSLYNKSNKSLNY